MILQKTVLFYRAVLYRKAAGFRLLIYPKAHLLRKKAHLCQKMFPDCHKKVHRKYTKNQRFLQNLLKSLQRIRFIRRNLNILSISLIIPSLRHLWNYIMLLRKIRKRSFSKTIYLLKCLISLCSFLTMTVLSL